MSWLLSLDTAIFRFINERLNNPFLDAIMPQFAGNAWFIPLLIVLAGWLVWKGGPRGRLLLLMLVVVIALGDGFVINTIKRALLRPRPYTAISDVVLSPAVGKGGSGSMPSSHTSTWFAATLIALVYYRRSWRFMLPLAGVMAFSRVYLGVHYPSDVLVGAILGAGYAAAGVWTLDYLWCHAGRHWFPIWWSRLPSLVTPTPAGADTQPQFTKHEAGIIDLQWLRLGYLVIAVLFITRLFYINSGRIELSEDEAYQWLWSKHLALSYYSKPPMIAFAQFLGTSIWGDRELGVRFLSPVISALGSLLILRFMAREVSASAGFLTVAVFCATPLLAVGSIVMTVDPLLVLFWSAAMMVGWQAMQPTGTTAHWLGTGLLMGLGFLSKYTAATQIVCFALFFALWPPARLHLRRRDPWLALAIFALCTLPVILWNAQHDWITVEHVGENAKLDKPWQPTLQYFFEFVASEAGLMNPIFFAAALWPMLALWRRREANPLLVYFFAMSAPVFFGYCLFSLHSRILPNWIAAAVVPMICLATAYWEVRWRAGNRTIRPWLIAGLVVGMTAVVLCHDTGLIQQIAKRRLPPKLDPLRRVTGWKETARTVAQARAELLSEGKDVLIIGSHYGLTGQISFYLPEARRGLPDHPLVYYRSSDRPRNQFFFWPGYRGQHSGANAIYVDEAPLPMLKHGWIWDWLKGGKDIHEPALLPPGRVPREVLDEFESITEIGIRDIKDRGQVVRRLQLYACRNLR